MTADCLIALMRERLEEYRNRLRLLEIDEASGMDRARGRVQARAAIRELEYLLRYAQETPAR